MWNWELFSLDGAPNNKLLSFSFLFSLLLLKVLGTKHMQLKRVSTLPLEGSKPNKAEKSH